MIDGLHDRLFDISQDGWLSLTDRYVVPPFTVLDTRQGYWQDRKRSWLALGIKSELGRYDDLIGSPLRQEWASNGNAHMAPSTSIFDPVLCEFVYRSFVANGGCILDPFAGGAVRGIVAHKLGRIYTGVDLSAEQIRANEAQADTITPHSRPRWIVGDSREIVALAPGQYDLVFTCPPYGDLERYSEDPRDLSAVDHEAFARGYSAIITATLALLRPDRFACIVVGGYRSSGGHLRPLPADTIRAATAAGCELYNEAILINTPGTAALRAPRQFDASRKLVTSHQTVLVFVKGDGRAAARAVEKALGA